MFHRGSWGWVNTLGFDDCCFVGCKSFLAFVLSQISQMWRMVWPWEQIWPWEFPRCPTPKTSPFRKYSTYEGAGQLWHQRTLDLFPRVRRCRRQLGGEPSPIPSIVQFFHNLWSISVQKARTFLRPRGVHTFSFNEETFLEKVLFFFVEQFATKNQNAKQKRTKRATACALLQPESPCLTLLTLVKTVGGLLGDSGETRNIFLEKRCGWPTENQKPWSWNVPKKMQGPLMSPKIEGTRKADTWSHLVISMRNLTNVNVSENPPPFWPVTDFKIAHKYVLSCKSTHPRNQEKAWLVDQYWLSGDKTEGQQHYDAKIGTDNNLNVSSEPHSLARGQ